MRVRHVIRKKPVKRRAVLFHHCRNPLLLEIEDLLLEAGAALREHATRGEHTQRQYRDQELFHSLLSGATSLDINDNKSRRHEEHEVILVQRSPSCFFVPSWLSSLVPDSRDWFGDQERRIHAR